MYSISKVPPSVWLGLLLAIILDTGVQVCWKISVLHVSPNAGFIETVIQTLHQPLFIAVVVMFVLQLLNWIKVLSKADLSYAQPITSLSYITVCGFSALFLKEILSFVQIIGIALILVGVWFISQTNHKSNTGQESST